MRSRGAAAAAEAHQSSIYINEKESIDESEMPESFLKLTLSLFLRLSLLAIDRNTFHFRGHLIQVVGGAKEVR